MLLISLLLAAPAIQLDWSQQNCPSRHALEKALAIYDLRVDAQASVKISARATTSPDSIELLLFAEGAPSRREVALPKRCADRAAVIAVVIDALVAPYFWPSGKAASAPSSSVVGASGAAASSAPAPKMSALDFLSSPAPAASAPVSMPASAEVLARKDDTASQAASSSSTETFVEAASLRVDPPTPDTLASRLAPAIWLFGAADVGVNEAVRGRIGLGVGVNFPERARWFVEGAYVSLRDVNHAPGRVRYGEGQLLTGADVRLWQGLFVGAGFGLQAVYAQVSGFNENLSQWILGPTSEIRAGYRHRVTRWLELGARLGVRLDFLQQRLLIDDVVVTELKPFHVGFAGTCALVF